MELPVKLESAQELKTELLRELRASTPQVILSRGMHAARSSAPRGLHHPPLVTLNQYLTFGVAAGPHSAARAWTRSIALGISRDSKHQHRLAVRVQRPELMRSPTIDLIRQRAHREVDVQLIGRIEKRTTNRPPWYRAQSRPLLIGCSAGHVDVTAGTVGGFVRRKDGIFALSNNHVFANEDRAPPADPVIQPGILDGGQAPRDTFGELGPTVRLTPNAVNRVDAALATLESVRHCEATLLRGIRGRDQHLKGVRVTDDVLGATVFKIGRTSGVTQGVVSATEIDHVFVDYNMGPLEFDDQIEIRGINGIPFSAGGDSGALIVDEDSQAVGLLFAGRDAGSAEEAGLTYAHPIRNVLTALDAELVT
jgi:hypothetical protein